MPGWVGDVSYVVTLFQSLFDGVMDLFSAYPLVACACLAPFIFFLLGGFIWLLQRAGGDIQARQFRAVSLSGKKGSMALPAPHKGQLITVDGAQYLRKGKSRLSKSKERR